MKAGSAMMVLGLAILVSGCQIDSSAGLGRESRPAVAGGWWRQWNDAAMRRDIETALVASPDLAAMAAKVARSQALAEGAQAAMRPTFNFRFGFAEGRQRNIDFGPFDLPPWQSGSFLSWEADLSGKLRAAQRSAVENRTAALEDLELARLVLATRLGALRLQLYRLNSEIAIVEESIESMRVTLGYLEERREAGLLADAAVDRQRAVLEKMARERLDLTRQREVTEARMRTLRGGTPPAEGDRMRFPEPETGSSRRLADLLASHPRLLAEAARVRAAFQLERSARLDLLPSFRLNVFATGGQRSISEQFRVWMGRAGPTLEIPVYDPARLARLKIRAAEARLAAANYRQAVLEVLEDLDTARLGLTSAHARLAAALREQAACQRLHDDARERFRSGVISQTEVLEAERDWLVARRGVTLLREAALSARLDLVKATGGADF